MTMTIAILASLLGMICIASNTKAHHLVDIKDVCNYACEKNCLYLGGVVGGTCINGNCVCKMKPSSPKPPVTVRTSGQKVVKPPFFHFIISVPAKWFPKKLKKNARPHYLPAHPMYYQG